MTKGTNDNEPEAAGICFLTCIVIAAVAMAIRIFIGGGP